MKYEFKNPKGSRVLTLTDDMFVRFGKEPYRLANLIRKGMGRKAIKEGQGQDGKDVAGVAQNSPCQLIWVGDKFKAVPYDAALARPEKGRVGTGTKRKFYLDLKAAMDGYKVLVGKKGKRVTGEVLNYENRPIAKYNALAEALVEGKITKHSADQLRFGKSRPFTIGIIGVDGITADDISNLTFYGEMLGVQVKWVTQEEAPVVEKAPAAKV